MRRTFVQRFPKAAITAALILSACSDGSPVPTSPDLSGVIAVAEGGSVKVTTNADAGPGSFREAIASANASTTISSVKFDKELGIIMLSDPVTYTGPQALEINGNGNRISGAGLGAGEDAFAATGGGDIILRRITVVDAPGVGIKVLVPATATGTLSVTFQDVSTRGNGLHGALINDQSGYLTDPESTSPDGSDASLRVRVAGSTFEDNGFSLIDQDGLRVNEGGAGSLDAVISHTVVTGNGGDGVELDERGEGSAVFTVEHSRLDENGSFTSADFDDGIDVDEAGPGGIDGTFNQVIVNGNYEQGVDLNENDAGDLRVSMNKVEASDNAEEGIEFEEDDDFAGGGDIVAVLHAVTTLRNGQNDGDAGLKLREKGNGNVSAQITKAVSSDNYVSGILVREDGSGDLHAIIENALALENAGDGIKFDENSSGNLDASVLGATSSDNDGAGVAAEQATTGSGALRILDLTASGNSDLDVKNDGGVVVQYL